MSARRKPRRMRSKATLRQQEADVRPDRQADFGDDQSQDALGKMAIAVARELGKQAARAWWKENR